MNIRDFFDVSLLEEVMTEWSKATGMATIAMDDQNEYITGEIGFTDFCTKYTRGTQEGLRRCILSDACNKDVYYCHAGLMDFSMDICLDDGTYLGKIIGGQILPQKPDLDKFRKLAVELGIDPDVYIEALSKVEIRPEDAIKASANLLGRVVNLLVNSEYIKKKQEKVIVQLDEENKMDPLTKVYNKAVFRTFIEEQIKKNSRFALFIVDVDDFKNINDTNGHMTGDDVLKAFAANLKSVFRATDMVGRFGGDEFYVIMQDIKNSKDVLSCGQKICNAAREVGSNGIKCGITASAGIALYPDHGESYKELLGHADKALYKVKEKGKDGFYLYEDENGLY